MESDYRNTAMGIKCSLRDGGKAVWESDYSNGYQMRTAVYRVRCKGA